MLVEHQLASEGGVCLLIQSGAGVDESVYDRGLERKKRSATHISLSTMSAEAKQLLIASLSRNVRLGVLQSLTSTLYARSVSKICELMKNLLARP